MYIGYAVGMFRIVLQLEISSIHLTRNPIFSNHHNTLGNLIGPQTFRENQAPAYTGGFIAMLICYCICIGLMAVYWTLASVLNSRREAEASPMPTLATINPNYASDVESLSDSVFSDMTDFQQQDFRYTT
jgi:MFS transporter, ACS family, allantoate permease